MSTFSGYERIADSIGDWRLDAADYRALRRVPWAVTEKIHGANLCLVTDGRSLDCANRKHLLARDERFFGYETVRDRLDDAARASLRCLQAIDALASRILALGELYGGGYAHAEIARFPGAQPIQTGVWYAPDIRFCAFDLRVETRGGSARCLKYDAAISIFARVGMPFAEPLFSGTCEAALAFPNASDSTIQDNWAFRIPVRPNKSRRY